MPAAFADGPVTGSIEGARMLAALALSLGIHAGMAAFVDLPGPSLPPATAGEVQVRLVPSSARSVLAPLAVPDSLDEAGIR